MSMIWYAVMRDREDNDWGYGSRDLTAAKQMARKMRSAGDPEAYIAVIDEGDGSVGAAVAVDEIHDLD